MDVLHCFISVMALGHRAETQPFNSTEASYANDDDDGDKCGPLVMVGQLFIQGECKIMDAADCECPDENICPDFSYECEVDNESRIYCCCYPVRAPDACFPTSREVKQARNKHRKGRKYGHHK